MASIAQPVRLLQLFLGRRGQESPGKSARLQQASRSLLQGISGLLEEGEGCLTEGLSQVHSRGGAQAALHRQQVSHGALGLCWSPAPSSKVGRNKVQIVSSVREYSCHLYPFFNAVLDYRDLLFLQKLLHVLESQVSFVQNLFQREPKALASLEAEWTPLEVRATCLQQRILDQEVVSQQRIQVCCPSLWPSVCQC